MVEEAVFLIVDYILPGCKGARVPVAKEQEMVEEAVFLIVDYILPGCKEQEMVEEAVDDARSVC